MMKHFSKIISILLTIIILGAALAGCSGKGNETSTQTPVQNDTQNESTSPSEASGSVQNESGAVEDHKVLVVYFSYTGHLDSMAHWIADETGGDIVRVTAKEAYPDDYDETVDRAKEERDDNARPEIAADLTKEQLAKYDTVFFGFPVWWYDLPMPMWTFLENYDFSGKTIIPFFSHEGSSNGAGALPTIEKLAEGATVRSDDALSIRGGKVDGSESDVREWVEGLNY
jgi:flavodoxin